MNRAMGSSRASFDQAKFFSKPLSNHRTPRRMADSRAPGRRGNLDRDVLVVAPTVRTARIGVWAGTLKYRPAPLYPRSTSDKLPPFHSPSPGPKSPASLELRDTAIRKRRRALRRRAGRECERPVQDRGVPEAWAEGRVDDVFGETGVIHFAASAWAKA